MKFKPKMGGDFKGALLRHGEKIVGVLVGLAALYLIYSATQQKQLPENQSPDNLKALARQASANIEQGGKLSIPPPPPAPSGSLNISVDDYATEIPLNPLIVEEKRLRPDPKLIPVEDVLAFGGSGGFAVETSATAGALPDNRAPTADNNEKIPDDLLKEFNGIKPTNGSTVKAINWAVILGKVPLAAQEEAYRKSFATAADFDPKRDIPVYWVYSVQRLDLDDANPQWKALPAVISSNSPFTSSQSDRDKYGWISEVTDDVDNKYRDVFLTAPLGPLVGRPWDPSVLHPDIFKPVAPPPAENTTGANNAAVDPATNIVAADSQPADQTAAAGQGMGIIVLPTPSQQPPPAIVPAADDVAEVQDVPLFRLHGPTRPQLPVSRHAGPEGSELGNRVAIS